LFGPVETFIRCAILVARFALWGIQAIPNGNTVRLKETSFRRAEKP
jgi:hypothetical protein